MVFFRKTLILRFFSEGGNEESDGDLFVVQEVSSSQKRPHTMIAEDEEIDGLEDEVGSAIG